MPRRTFELGDMDDFGDDTSREERDAVRVPSIVAVVPLGGLLVKRGPLRPRFIIESGALSLMRDHSMPYGLLWRSAGSSSSEDIWIAPGQNVNSTDRDWSLHLGDGSQQVYGGGSDRDPADRPLDRLLAGSPDAIVVVPERDIEAVQDVATRGLIDLHIKWFDGALSTGGPSAQLYL